MKTTSRIQISKMSAAELVVELGRRGIKSIPEETLKGTSVCPNCGHRGPIQKDFGVRIMRGSLWPQSWCRTCRAGGKN